MYARQTFRAGVFGSDIATPATGGTTVYEDDGARRQYLPEAMTWLWRGYPIKKP